MEDEDRYTRITLRIPKTLHNMLVDEADRTSKSLNAEIVARLEGSFSGAVSDEALKMLAVKLAQAEKDAALFAFMSEKRLVDLALQSEYLFLVLSVAKLLGLEEPLLEDYELSEANEISEKATRELASRGEEVHLDSLAKSVEQADARLQEARADLEASRPVSGSVPQHDRMDFYRRAIERRHRIMIEGDVQQPRPRTYGPAKSPNAKKRKS